MVLLRISVSLIECACKQKATRSAYVPICHICDNGKMMIKHEQLKGYINTQTVISIHSSSIFMGWRYVGLDPAFIGHQNKKSGISGTPKIICI